MKFNKKILVIICNVILLNVAGQCFATTNENTIYSKNGTNYIDKVYSVEQTDEQKFFNELQHEITINDIKYAYVDKKIENQDTIETKDIETTKTCVLNTNNREKIIETLGMTIDYNEDGYIGTYTLDADSINVITHNNGYYDKLIEKTVEYTDLSKNDLDYIQKQITEKNKTLDLLDTKWEITETEKIGEASVGSQYKAICYYATKERVYRPNTYTVTAKYIGTAEKEIVKPLKITVSYKEENTEIDKVEETENNIIPILGGTSGVVIFLGGLLLFMKNVKVYNYQNGKWTYIGKALLLKGKLRLDKFRSKEVTNKYRIELSKNLTKKYKDKTITIYKGTNSIKKIVHTSDDKIDFEVRI